MLLTSPVRVVIRIALTMGIVDANRRQENKEGYKCEICEAKSQRVSLPLLHFLYGLKYA